MRASYTEIELCQLTIDVYRPHGTVVSLIGTQPFSIMREPGVDDVVLRDREEQVSFTVVFDLLERSLVARKEDGPLVRNKWQGGSNFGEHVDPTARSRTAQSCSCAHHLVIPSVACKFSSRKGLPYCAMVVLPDKDALQGRKTRLFLSIDTAPRGE